MKLRLLVVNQKKSEVLFIPGHTNRRARIKQVCGIPLVKSAKYLGVTYFDSLSIQKTLAAHKPKYQYQVAKMYSLLKCSDFRTRLNLWKVLVKPIFMMCIQVLGYHGANGTKIGLEYAAQKIRASAKSFTLSPRSADKVFFDAVC